MLKVAHDQTELDRAGVTFVEHGFAEVASFLPVAALGHFHLAASGQRFGFHKQRGDAVTHVFRIDDLPTSGSGGNRSAHLTDRLFAEFVDSADRNARIVWEAINRRHLFHRGH
ncbi:MAG: hypothetical protein RL077_949 [Verrucomicrobiota bacterium]